MDEVRLRSSDFRRERQSQWHAMEILVRKVERSGLAALTAEELHKLPGLYRAAISSLSVARAISLDRNMLDYLESLVTRAYVCVYGVKPRTGEVVKAFFLKTFPAAVRRYGLGVILAVALLAAGTAVGLVYSDPEAYAAIMPEDMAQGRSPTSTTEELRDVLYSGGESTDTSLGFFATYLFTHNAKVGIFSFVLGFALGLPTVILIFYNGLLLGALAGLYASRGLGAEFWAWVLPHGVTELLACCLFGGAGFHLALAVIRPGRHGRMHALMKAGRKASMIALGALLMLILAALIEGFFRQLVHSVFIRYAVACITLAFWGFYFVIQGRGEVRA